MLALANCIRGYFAVSMPMISASRPAIGFGVAAISLTSRSSSERGCEIVRKAEPFQARRVQAKELAFRRPPPYMRAIPHAELAS